MGDKDLHKGSCHCGLVEFEVALPRGLESLSRCNCSICARHGAAVMSVPLLAFNITKGANQLTLYQFNTKVAEHYFCSNCGIYTHHKRRSHPNQYAVNVACIEGVNLLELGDVITTDGLNHSCDREL